MKDVNTCEELTDNAIMNSITVKITRTFLDKEELFTLYFKIANMNLSEAYAMDM